MRRLLWGLLLLLVGLTIAGYASLPFWLPGLAAQLVPGLVVADADRPGLQEWRVGRVVFDDGRLRAELADVVVRYDARRRALLTVDMALADVHVAAWPEGSGDAPSIPAVPALNVQRLRIAFEPLDLTLEGSISTTAAGAFRLRLQEGDNLVEADGSFDEQAFQVAGTLALAGSRLTTAATAAGVPITELSLDGDFSARLLEPLQAQAANLTGTANLHVAGQIAALEGRVQFAARQVVVARQDAWQIDVPQLNLRGDHGAGWFWQTPITATVTDDQTMLVRAGQTVDARFDLAGDTLQGQGDFALGSAEFVVLSAFSTELDGAVRGSFALADGQVRVQARASMWLASGDYRAEFSGFSASTQGSLWNLVGTGVRVRSAQLSLPPLDADLVAADDGGWRVSGTVRGAGLVAQPTLFLKDPMRIDADYTLDVSEPLLARWLGWKEAYDLTAGRFNGTLRASLGTRNTYTVQGALTDGAALYDDLIIQGIDGRYEVRGDDDAWRAMLPAAKVAAVDVGVVLRDISFDAEVSEAQVTVEALQGALLGGAFAVRQPLVYDVARGRSVFEVALDNLDLAEVVALEGEDIRATGRLSGNIPVAITETGVSVTGGTVAAASGGTIQLDEKLARSIAQPGLDIVLRALEDFRYSVLRAGIDYAENGDFKASVRLEGSNPAIEAGRAIHYNLNISENVPVLLKSLRLQDEVTRRVERQVDRKFNQRGKQ